MIALKPMPQSAAIESAGYDAASRTLAVRYKNAKSTHHYLDVPPEVSDGLFAADSAGRYLTANVRSAFEVQTIPDSGGNDDQTEVA